MRVGSLFSGIGGLELGLERAGMRVLWQVEVDEWCRRVLARHFPNAVRYGDVRAVRGEHVADSGRAERRPQHSGSNEGRQDLEKSSGQEGSAFPSQRSALAPVDLICGGFPCQPVSTAGQRKGEADERWLWPEFRRIIREVGPRYVVVENVPGLLSLYLCPICNEQAKRIRGLLTCESCGWRMGDGTADDVPWNGMAEVLADLAALGFDAEWDSIGAADVGAPHLRKRVFIVAHATGERQRSGLQGRGVELAGPEPGRDADERSPAHTDTDGGNGGSRRSRRPEHGGQGLAEPQRPYVEENAADTAGPRRAEGRPGEGWPVWDKARRPESERRSNADAGSRRYRTPEAAIRTGWNSPQHSDWWAVEPDVGRVAHGVSARVDRLRGLGNAVVPQVAEHIGRLIMEREA